jgi:transcriptional regulator with XRE-family HTH domain
MSFPYSTSSRKTGIIPGIRYIYETVLSRASEKIKMEKDFQHRLRLARESRGLSQADLAKKTGLQPAAISHFETGQRSPSFDNLRKLSDALNVSVDYLLGRIDEEKHGKGIAAAPRAQQLFRNAEKLSDESFRALETMAKALLQEEQKRKQSDD